MGEIREVDAIQDAIIETEREIAGQAWGIEETERLDAGGDRSLESMGEGLEGQHEQDPEEAGVDGEEAEGDEEAGEGEGETEEEEADGEEGAEAQAGQEAGQGQQQRREPEGRVPSGKYREAAERARLAEDERDRLRAELATAKQQGGNPNELAELRGQIAALTRVVEGRQQPQQRTEEPPAKAEVPDIFENPTGFAEHITKSFQSELAKRDQAMAAQRVENSMAIAHAFHKETFETAFGELNKLNPQNPDDRLTVQKIYASPNPGEALVTWHKQSVARARMGNDPDAYEARIRQETRDALLKDPEFHKQLMASLRGEAETGGANGGPRTETRLPRSLNRAAGTNRGSAERIDPRAADDSEQGIAESAWRT